MNQWKKQDKYYATAGQYTMSWLDNKVFTLYHKNEFIINGTRQECLDEYFKHFSNAIK